MRFKVGDKVIDSSGREAVVTIVKEGTYLPYHMDYVNFSDSFASGWYLGDDVFWAPFADLKVVEDNPPTVDQLNSRVFDNLNAVRHETRVVDPSTGGEKGAKPEDFSLLDQDFLAEMARVLNYGQAKYSRDNWRKGYSWSLSFSAWWRHGGWRFWKKKEALDKESQLHHMAHAAVHCMFMYVFDTEGLGTDDR